MGKEKKKKVIVLLMYMIINCVKGKEFNVLNEVHLESNHLNIGTVRDMQGLRKKLGELEQMAGKLDNDTSLRLKIKTQFHISLDFGYIKTIDGHKQVKSQVFHNIKERAKMVESEMDELCNTRVKRSWEVLGDILNTITGVPSAQMHEEVIGRLDQLENSMNSVISHGTNMAQELKVNAALTYQNSQEIDSLSKIIAENVKEIEIIEENQIRISNIINFHSAATKLLELITLEIREAKNILLLGKMNKGDHNGMPASIIHEALDHAPLSDDLQPIFPRNETDKYYSLSIFKATCKSDRVYVTGRIPLIDPTRGRNLTLLTAKEKNSVEIDLTPFAFTLVDEISKTHAYLTMNDLGNCIDLNSKLLCSKRLITIDNNMKGKILVYDIAPELILVSAKGTTHVICNNKQTIFRYKEETISLVPRNCHMVHEHFQILQTQQIHHVFQNLTQKEPVFNYTEIDIMTSSSTQLSKVKQVQKELKTVQGNVLDIINNITSLQEQQGIQKLQRNHNYNRQRYTELGLISTIPTTSVVLLILILYSCYLTKRIQRLENDIGNLSK